MPSGAKRRRTAALDAIGAIVMLLFTALLIASLFHAAPCDAGRYCTPLTAASA